MPTFHFMGLSSKLGRADSYRPTRPARVPPLARIQPLDPDRTAPVTSGVDGKRNTVHPVGNEIPSALYSGRHRPQHAFAPPSDGG